MVSESYYIKFCWGARKETAEECAVRLIHFLKDLANIDSVFNSWTMVGGKKWRCDRQPAKTQVIKWLTESISRPDIDNHELPELGLSAAFYTNERDSPLALNIKCSSYSPWILNVCSISLPATGKVLDRILKVSILLKISKSIVLNWQPEHGVISYHPCAVGQSPSNFLLDAGWITYLSTNQKNIILPNSFLVEEHDCGRFVIITNELFTDANTKHLTALKELSTLLTSHKIS